MRGGRARAGEQLLFLDLAEIGALEEFGGQDDLRALRDRLLGERRHGVDVRPDGAGQGKLQCGDGEAAGHGRPMPEAAGSSNGRTEERRVGKEWGSTGRYGGLPCT